VKKPKDVTELASRLASAASTPLVLPPAPAPVVQVATAPVPEATKASQAVRAGKSRKAPQRSTIPLFLRLSPELFERYDGEAVRRTKETGRGVTVQQVILDRLEAQA
jgi:hypothetical protein